MDFKPKAFICENGHITKISRQKLRFADGMCCPVCDGKGNLVCVGIDFGECNKNAAEG
ncbi:MAG: hypothetical protein KID04_04440 [Clostridium sp.]|nr:hypothetical protein [Clostridium sp.]